MMFLTVKWRIKAKIAIRMVCYIKGTKHFIHRSIGIGAFQNLMLSFINSDILLYDNVCMLLK